MIIQILKVIFTLAITLIAIAMVGLGGTLTVTTARAERHVNQPLFESGHTDFDLAGPYQVSTNIQIPDWTGKTFGSQNYNIFKPAKKYPFRIITSRGLRDPDTTVFRTDYNLQGNPWGLRLFLIEEIVTTKNQHILGKMHIRIMPYLVFTLGYFELTPD